VGDRLAEGRCLGNLGALCHDARDVDGARVHYRRALPIFRALNEQRREGIFLCNLALLEQEGGQFEDARARLQRAASLLENVCDRRLYGIALGNLGALEHEGGALDRSDELQMRALEVLHEAGDLASELLATLRLAALRADRSQNHEARTLIDRASAIVDGLEDPYAEALVSLEHATPAAVRARIETARTPHRSDASLAERSDDARWMIRLLERKTHTSTLYISRASRRFRWNDGAWEDLARFGSLWRILDALVDAHLRDRTATLTADVLIAAGWPGERMIPEAASNRLYVALSGLRKRGLREVIVRVGDGYSLEPGVKLQQED
jgi:hypothetical protein